MSDSKMLGADPIAWSEYVDFNCNQRLHRSRSDETPSLAGDNLPAIIRAAAK